MLQLSAETEQLIREKARADGKTPEEFLRDLVMSSAPTIGRKPDIARMKEIAKRAASRPLLDSRSEKEITDEGWGL